MLPGWQFDNACHPTRDRESFTVFPRELDQRIELRHSTQPFDISKWGWQPPLKPSLGREVTRVLAQEDDCPATLFIPGGFAVAESDEDVDLLTPKHEPSHVSLFVEFGVLVRLGLPFGPLVFKWVSPPPLDVGEERVEIDRITSGVGPDSGYRRAPFSSGRRTDTHESDQRGHCRSPLFADSEAFQPSGLQFGDELFRRGRQSFGCSFKGENQRETRHRTAYP